MSIGETGGDKKSLLMDGKSWADRIMEQRVGQLVAEEEEEEEDFFWRHRGSFLNRFVVCA